MFAYVYFMHRNEVDHLKAKNKDFQAMKKGQMTKAQFIKKYPNSQTAKKARMK